MKICFIGPANSSHIVKWCHWFTERGHEVHVVSFVPGIINNSKVHFVDLGVDVNGSDINKLKYLLSGRRIRKEIKDICPDIINVHYATSYGAAVALSGIERYVLSVWGSDIYAFPQKSPFHKALLRYSLKKARYLFSTSQSMAEEARKYTNKEFQITPFGVDMALFNPVMRTRPYEDKLFVVGTVKSLDRIYGINYLLEAAAIVKREKPDINISVRIAGDGPQEDELRQLAADLEIEEIVSFLGRIRQEEAAIEWANMDVAVIPSARYESFGVAAVEAQACGTPVIISEVEGLMETTDPGVTSIVVPKKNAAAIAAGIVKLYYEQTQRRQMGINARQYVEKKYELNRCFIQIENFFNSMK